MTSAFADPPGGRPAGARTVRSHNLGLVLRAVAAGSPVPRARVAEVTGLTRGTVSSLVDALLAARLLEELPADPGRRGRPALPLRLRRDGPGGLGLEVGVGHLRACVLGLGGQVRAEADVEHDTAAAGPEATGDALAGLAGGLLEELGGGAAVVGARVALPGLVADDGALSRAPNLPGWDGARVAELLSARLPVTCAGANEADLAALGELRAGGHAHLRDFLAVSAEVGVGAGVVLGGRLFRGGGGHGGELGHVVVDPGGAVCRCGGRGCLEQVAGQRALLRAAGRSRVDTLQAALERGDARAEGAVATAAAALGTAVASAVALLDVPTVVLGGLYARLGERVAGPVRAELGRRSPTGTTPQVLLSRLGGGAAVRGGAADVLAELLADPTAHESGLLG